MQITKQSNTYAITELTQEQIELIQIAAGTLTEAQPKNTSQGRFLRGLAIKIDQQLPNTNKPNEL